MDKRRIEKLTEAFRKEYATAYGIVKDSNVKPFNKQIKNLSDLTKVKASQVNEIAFTVKTSKGSKIIRIALPFTDRQFHKILKSILTPDALADIEISLSDLIKFSLINAKPLKKKDFLMFTIKNYIAEILKATKGLTINEQVDLIFANLNEVTIPISDTVFEKRNVSKLVKASRINVTQVREK